MQLRERRGTELKCTKENVEKMKNEERRNAIAKTLTFDFG